MNDLVERVRIVMGDPAADEIERLQRYKEFAMKCAAVNNHEGWQGAYFREAQALFLTTKDTDNE